MVSLARRFALVPLGPPLLSYGSRCKAMLTAVDDAVQLVVDRPYKVGDPIFVWCGPPPNSKLLINYVFVDDDNPYDRIMIEVIILLSPARNTIFVRVILVHVNTNRTIIPESLRERIKRYEQYKWKETRGVDEEFLIRDLPKDM
ncbi:hypothetical protein AgCh_031304 [Apium graveolens]